MRSEEVIRKHLEDLGKMISPATPDPVPGKVCDDNELGNMLMKHATRILNWILEEEKGQEYQRSVELADWGARQMKRVMEQRALESN